MQFNNRNEVTKAVKTVISADDELFDFRVENITGPKIKQLDEYGYPVKAHVFIDDQFVFTNLMAAARILELKTFNFCVIWYLNDIKYIFRLGILPIDNVVLEAFKKAWQVFLNYVGSQVDDGTDKIPFSENMSLNVGDTVTVGHYYSGYPFVGPHDSGHWFDEKTVRVTELNDDYFIGSDDNMFNFKYSYDEVKHVNVEVISNQQRGVICLELSGPKKHGTR